MKGIAEFDGRKVIFPFAVNDRIVIEAFYMSVKKEACEKLQPVPWLKGQ